MSRTSKAALVADKIIVDDEWYTSEQFRDQFDNPAARYTVESRWSIWDKFINFWIASAINQDKCELKILDAGCGDGINLQWLYREFLEKKVFFNLHGVDYNPIRITRAKEVVPKAHLSLASLGNLPFIDNGFDLIVCNHVLEHIPDDISAMKELFRVLKPQGVLIAGVPNEGCLLARIRNHFFQRSILLSTDHVNFYTNKSFLELVYGLSFESVQVRHNGFFWPHMRLSYLLGRTKLGQRIIDTLGRLFKSQASDLILVCKK